MGTADAHVQVMRRGLTQSDLKITAVEGEQRCLRSPATRGNRLNSYLTGVFLNFLCKVTVKLLSLNRNEKTQSTLDHFWLSQMQ